MRKFNFFFKRIGGFSTLVEKMLCVYERLVYMGIEKEEEDYLKFYKKSS